MEHRLVAVEIYNVNNKGVVELVVVF
jgi:hypothetical protein